MINRQKLEQDKYHIYISYHIYIKYRVSNLNSSLMINFLILVHKYTALTL